VPFPFDWEKMKSASFWLTWGKRSARTFLHSSLFKNCGSEACRSKMAKIRPTNSCASTSASIISLLSFSMESIEFETIERFRVSKKSASVTCPVESSRSDTSPSTLSMSGVGKVDTSTTWSKGLSMLFSALLSTYETLTEIDIDSSSSSDHSTSMAPSNAEFMP